MWLLFSIIYNYYYYYLFIEFFISEGIVPVSLTYVDIQQSEHHTATYPPSDIKVETNELSEGGADHELEVQGGVLDSDEDLESHSLMSPSGIKCYRCMFCSKICRSRSVLRSHLRSHTGIRPFTCAECGKTFMRKHHMIEHERTHTGERTLKCEECEFSAKRSKELKNHITCVHNK